MLLDFGLLVRAVISPFISIMIFDDVYICLIFCDNFHAGLILYPPPQKKKRSLCQFESPGNLLEPS